MKRFQIFHIQSGQVVRHIDAVYGRSLIEMSQCKRGNKFGIMTIDQRFR